MLLRLSRRLAVALGIAAIAAIAAPTAAMAAVDITHRFSADSGDRCGYGYTFGHMTWSSSTPVVAVRGAVVDNPVDATFACRDDGRITVAHFVAVSVNGAERHAERADNSQQDFGFRLGVNSATARIAYVTVQVCRYSSSAVPDYCGDIKTYRNPL